MTFVIVLLAIIAAVFVARKSFSDGNSEIGPINPGAPIDRPDDLDDLR